MQFKNIKKSPSKKITTPKNTSDNMKKEEIKGIIEETVEEVLKEQSEITQEPTTEPVEEHTPIAEENVTVPDSKEEAKTDNASAVHLSDTPFEETSEDSGENKDNKNAQELEKTEQTETEGKGGEVIKTNEPESATPTVPVVDVSPFSTPLPAVENQEDSSDTSKKSSMLRLFLVFMLIGLAAGAVLWFVVFHNMFNFTLPNIPGISSATKPTPTKAPSLTLSPTPKPVDVSKYTISVLNGSGIAGAAAKAKETLTTAGFTVGSTGNATNSNFTETVIAAKSSVDPEALDKLKQTLGQTYAVSSQILSVGDSQTADIVVTIGSTTK